MSTIRDITDQERHEAQLEYDASRDSLTGLLNRRVFDRDLDAEIARARRRLRPLSIALLDLDHFKPVNGRCGHQVGDLVLQETARRLAGIVRDGEYITRIGGEEFGWILPDASTSGAHAAAERARKAISSTPVSGGPGQSLSRSASASSPPTPTTPKAFTTTPTKPSIRPSENDATARSPTRRPKSSANTEAEPNDQTHPG